MTMLAACIFTACSSSDDNEGGNNSANLYAIIKPEGAQLIGEFKVKDTERIDSKAYPIPTQYVILFYSNGSFLFDAKLNSSISSYLPKGLTFCHFLSDKNGLARYDLGATRIVSADREVIEGNPTEQQEQGMQRMYQILQKAGKIRSNIDYDFQFK